MSEGEHTIISKIPRERLNQIAARKLAALAIPVRLGADRETLEGELRFARLAHPATGQPIPRASFAVAGHDCVRFSEAPLSALGSVSFYDLDKASALEQRIAEGLQSRAAAVQEQAARLRVLGLQVTVEVDRLAARAVVRTPTHAFELLGGSDGIRVARVAPVGGQPFAVPASFPDVPLDDLGTRTDIEVYLAHRVPELERAAREAVPESSRLAPAAPGNAGEALVAMPPPRNALTLRQLGQAFGEEGVLAPNTPVEVFQEFQYGGTRFRFVAAREAGTLFRGRLIGPSGDVWTDRFDLAEFPGALAVAASALGAGSTRPGADGAAPPAPLPEDAGAGAPEARGGPQLPRPGEVWVMNVVVEDLGAEEVRYVGTDIDGRPYGAARVLKRSDFEAVFFRQGSAWRLLVVVDQVQGDAVLYRQLDLHRQPMGAPRRMATAVLMANFVAEAAAH